MVKTPQPRRAPKLFSNKLEQRGVKIAYETMQPKRSGPRGEETNLKHVMTYQAHRNTLLQLNIEMHSQDLYSLGRDNTMKIWNIAT